MELNSFLAMLINGFYTIVNFLIDGVCLILPTFSIADFLSSSLGAFSPFLGVINYFVPFTQMIVIATAFLLCFGTQCAFSHYFARSEPPPGTGPPDPRPVRQLPSWTKRNTN